MYRVINQQVYMDLDIMNPGGVFDFDGFLQGNADWFTFNLRFYAMGSPLDATVDKVKVWVITPLGEKWQVSKLNPGSSHEVDFKGEDFMTNWAGTYEIIVEVDIPAGKVYTFSTKYYVNANKAHQLLPISPADTTRHVLNDLSNVADATFKAKGVQSGLASADLANVAAATLKAKGVGAGLLATTLDTVDLPKLSEKVELTDAYKALKQSIPPARAPGPPTALQNLSNVSGTDIDAALKRSAVIEHMNASLGRTVSQDALEASLGANGYELTDTELATLDLTKAPYNVPHVWLRIQFHSDGQDLALTLPPVAQRTTFLVSMIGVGKSTTLTINPAPGESIDGSSAPYIIAAPAEEGDIIGYLLPIVNEGSYEFVSLDKVRAAAAALPFIDSEGREFEGRKVQSLDHSIRVANMGGTVDLSYTERGDDGLLAFLGYDGVLNSKFPNELLLFSDQRIKGSAFVYADDTAKSFVLQDVDPSDDPNVSGGTTFIAALTVVPPAGLVEPFTQAGSVVVSLVDAKGDIIKDLNGYPVVVTQEVKAGDTFEAMRYVAQVRFSEFTRVHMRIELKFPTEELLTVGAGSCVCFQAIGATQRKASALAAYTQYTGHIINYQSKSYTYNYINLARLLVFDVPVAATGVGTMPLGDSLYLDTRSNMLLEIKDYHLVLKDDGKALPVWSLSKLIDRLDTFFLQGKTLDLSVTLKDSYGALRATLLSSNDPKGEEVPKVERYDNGSPVFSAGWSEVDSLFMSEEYGKGDHVERHTFTLPTGVERLALLVYTVGSSSPLQLSLKDIEGDISPRFDAAIAMEDGLIEEMTSKSTKEYIKALTKCPPGVVSYRYTLGAAEANLPAGVLVPAGADVKVTPAWHDTGSYDPQGVQGDYLFNVDALVTFSTSVLAFNEKGTDNQLTLKLIKVSDGSTVKGGSVTVTVPANTTTPLSVSLPAFTFEVSKGESYRLVGSSNIDDGVYIQGAPTTRPLIESVLEVDKYSYLMRILAKKN